GKNKALVKDAERIEKLKPLNSKPETEDTKKAESSDHTEARRSDAIVSAVKKTIKPEIASHDELMGMLSNRFGGDGIDALASAIIEQYKKSASIGDFENLFTDGGKNIYTVLQNQQLENERYSLSTDNGANMELGLGDDAQGLFTPHHVDPGMLNDKLDRWLQGELKSDESLEFGDTPYILTRLGATNLPVIMHQDVLVKLTGGKHDVSLDTIRNMPNLINDPIMVLASDTVPGAYVILTEDVDKSGRPVVAALHLNKRQSHFYVNRVASVYGRNNAQTFIENQARLGNIKYVDDIKIQDWPQSRGLQLPKLADTNPVDNIILYKSDIVNTYSMQNSNNNAKESGDHDERRNDVTTRSVGRSISEGANEPSGSLYQTTGRAEENGGKRTDTESSRRIYAENVRAVQGTEIRQQGAFRCEFVNQEYYTDDMRAIEEYNAKRGIKHTYFFFDSGEVVFKPSVKFRGAITKDGDLYIQCNHAKYSPEQINKHELVHQNYNSKDVVKIRKYINDHLTENEKRYIIDVMYARYGLVCKGDKNKIFEEFVCDVLSGMNTYSVQFKNVAQEYWSRHTDLIDNYSAADYTGSIDAGGALLSSQEYADTTAMRESVLYKGQPIYSLNNDKDKLRYSTQGLRIPKSEYYKFARAVGTDYYNSNKTHSGLQYQSVVGTKDHILYVYEDYGFDNYKIVGRVDYANVETANKVMELIDNGKINRISDLVSRLSEWLETRQGGYSIYNAYTKKRRSSGSVRALSSEQSRSNARGTDGSSGRDAENGRTDDINFSIEDNNANVALGLGDDAQGLFTPHHVDPGMLNDKLDRWLQGELKSD
ncbi:MAG: hypothetical protein K6E29_05010, partial [Cyanobacteria bacterium RUI128]|nr:hypothetical protein [Cyanobacteria bacterium RUI128]